MQSIIRLIAGLGAWLSEARPVPAPVPVVVRSDVGYRTARRVRR